MGKEGQREIENVKDSYLKDDAVEVAQEHFSSIDVDSVGHLRMLSSGSPSRSQVVSPPLPLTVSFLVGIISSLRPFLP